MKRCKVSKKGREREKRKKMQKRVELMLLRCGGLRLKSPAVENIKAMSRSPTYIFSAGFQAAPPIPGDGSNEDCQSQQQQQEPNKTIGDAMSHSFGEGYSTRSEEEGFGGIYGANQSLSGSGEHENHPGKDSYNFDYDKSQGSEVKEKEKSRNQA